MNNGRGGYPGDIRGRGGFSHGRGGSRTYSGSSGSSGGQHNYNRPVLRPMSSPRGRMTPPTQYKRSPDRVDSPATQVREQLDFTMNGHSISETYTPRRSNVATSPDPSVPPTPTTQTNYRGNTLTCQLAVQRPFKGNSPIEESHDKEYKIKIAGVPKTCWTKQVYETMSRYGNVIRIGMEPSFRDNIAFVTFL
jgi:RNA-dependent RNA polymerase